MSKKLIYIFILSLLIACNTGERPLIVSFTGDVNLDRGVNDQLLLYGDSLLTNSFSFLQKSDFVLINLEGTLTDSGIEQTDKYNFRASEDKAVLLKNAGVTHVSVANNHIFDYGKIGFENTVNSLIKNRITPMGNVSEPVVISNGKYTCAVLSASLSTHNDSLPISNIDELKESVKSFMNKSAMEPLIVYIHWGLELQSTPERWQSELAADLVGMGVDAIVGHHPHVTQSIEFINNKPVFYSIGNFIADAYLPDTDLSYTVAFNISDSIEKVSIIPIELERYFPKILPFDRQITTLKKHMKHSNASLYYSDGKWIVKQTRNVDFSENTDLWMIAEDNAISIIQKMDDEKYVLSFQKDGLVANVLRLNGKLSEIQIADINNDSQIDVLLGISKKVNFDPIVKKRINIYTFKNNALEPLWLGTKFIDDVVSFDVFKINNLNYLSTVERMDDNQKINRIYEWDDFGFGLIEFNDIKK
jgi:hypothetical protein